MTSIAIEERIIRIAGFDTLLITNEKGVRVDDRVEVLGKGEEIIDPLTNQSLGKYYSVKAILEVAKVFDGFAICKTPRKRKGVSSLQGGSLVSRYLNVEEGDVEPLPKGSDATIKVGDHVRIAR